MSKAIKFPEANDVFKCPEDMQDCNDLHVLRTLDPLRTYEDEMGIAVPFPIVISCWEFTHEELMEIASTGKVYLVIWGNRLPPVSLIHKL